MTITFEAGSNDLTDRVAALVRDIEATKSARGPIDAEIQAELLRLDTIAARADVSGSLWLSPNPNFSPSAFNNSVLGALLLIEPDKTRKAIAAGARLRAETFKGLRMTATEKEQRLARLGTDLRVARAKLEQQRRQIEQQTNDVLPRIGDDPSIWLLPPAQLDELAAAARAERERALDILDACNAAGQPERAAHLIGSNASVREAKAALAVPAPQAATRQAGTPIIAPEQLFGRPMGIAQLVGGFDPAAITRELQKPTLQ